MPATIPNLWPQKYKVDVQTPLTILRVQAGFLSQVTSGILDGVVETEETEKLVQHRLVVIAPAFNHYRHTLVTAIHKPSIAYPAEVRAEALAEQVTEAAVYEPNGPIRNYTKTGYPTAHNDSEMQKLVQKALQSSETEAIILSLIAKSNEYRKSNSEPEA